MYILVYIHTYIIHYQICFVYICICGNTSACYHAEHGCNQCNMRKRRKYVVFLKAIRVVDLFFNLGMNNRYGREKSFFRAVTKVKQCIYLY